MIALRQAAINPDKLYSNLALEQLGKLNSLPND
jgi:hypothetical protein